MPDVRRTQRIYSQRAANYSWTHHLQTLWRDHAWRKKAVAALPEGTASVLDLCTGTGMTAAAIQRRFPTCRIVGIDLNRDMLCRTAASGAWVEHVWFVRGNVEALPFPGETFDAVVSVCGLGGVRDPAMAVSEARRVLVRQGVFFSIEMCAPPGVIQGRWLHKLVVEPWVKRFWGFRDIDLEGHARSAGFDVLRCEYRMELCLGGVCEIWGRS